MTLNDIIEDFKGFNFPEEILVLDQGVKIINQKGFYQSHLKVLLAQSGNMRFKPYFDRLVLFHQIHFKNETKH